MEDTLPAAGERERRKHVKLLLRRDLLIESQKYEGRTFYVVKDPVSLRYYRLKDNEYYLLQFLDGRRTLEDAQKAYEKHYRPDRLKLEDLEAFAQQLLKAGLAQNESPKAGQQLYENRRKRLRTEWLQALTNILYIKLPLFDPDRLLTKMLGYLGWIFTTWFTVVSVGVMLAALLLVLTHFDVFRSKLPDYHAFFTFKTVINLWIALGCVKVIHEFGHGLSCKAFGGEVHEMGALLLCLSPALYCNVSDAWTLPNKWHRIIISAAGIYVELIIAALATFVWWNTPSHPFINNLSLSLMVVCSVSTVVFNANPLMRYDGYYVLADWLEIPNLRERSNRFLKNTVLEHCLGVEVQPEPYMALWRKILFISYAVVSYIYRWVVTFGILWFFSSFLKPYKLEVISGILTAAAIGSMVGWPLGRLIKNLHRRGRLPDMKGWRVAITSTVLLVLILFVSLVPVPLGRVRAVGLVQAKADAGRRVYTKHGGILEELRVRPGQHVEYKEVLARFRDLEAEKELANQKAEFAIEDEHIKLLKDEMRLNTDPKETARLVDEKTKAESKRREAETKIDALKKMLEEEMVLRAPLTGVVGIAPRLDEVGKSFEKDKPFLTINVPQQVRVALPLVTSEFNRLKANLESVSPAAAKTFGLLHRKVTLHCRDERLADVLDKLQGQVRGFTPWLDPEGRVPADMRVSYDADKKPLNSLLDDLCERHGLGYVVVSDPGSPRDGWVQVKAGRERGTPEGRPLADLEVTVRVHGRDARTWKGRITSLPQSEAKTIPLTLSSKQGGPVATKPPAPPQPGSSKTGAQEEGLPPQTQHYIVYVDILDPDDAIVPGNLAQVKVRCQPETCLHWLWRTIHDTFDIGLW
jgi:putative peptide zinc metalloprotease protein